MIRKIMGKNTVEEVATYQHKRIVSITTSSKELLNDYQRKGFKVKLAEKNEMNKIVQSDSHQGIIAEVLDEEISFKTCIDQLKKKNKSVVVLLDSIQDPQNMGAIMRACECFGVDWILHTKKSGNSYHCSSFQSEYGWFRNRSPFDSFKRCRCHQKVKR